MSIWVLSTVSCFCGRTVSIDGIQSDSLNLFEGMLRNDWKLKKRRSNSANAASFSLALKTELLGNYRAWLAVRRFLIRNLNETFCKQRWFLENFKFLNSKIRKSQSADRREGPKGKIQ